jgi:glycosyltransferase involved in cell wall biosynthesis
MIFFLVPFIIYILTLIYFSIGNILFTSIEKKPTENIGISIIVAIRNGEASLINLIENLSSQKYQGLLEFLLVDDESTDKTKQIILDIQKKDSRFKYLSSINGNNNLKYKKRALDLGIQKATYDSLLFTDVDCSIPPHWVETMSGYFNKGYEYLVGHSFTRDSGKFNLVSNFQRLDLLLLMIMCRGSSYFSSPWASSGQNQGFLKSSYVRVGGFMGVTKFYGDDTAFLQLCNKTASHAFFLA